MAYHGSRYQPVRGKKLICRSASLTGRNQLGQTKPQDKGGSEAPECVDERFAWKRPCQSADLDFGTSNTTLGTIEGRGPVLVALEAGQTTIPSAIFYEVDGAVLIGRKAIEAYVDGAPGRLMRSLKSVLGTSLIDETTRLGRERTGFRDVIAYYSAR